MRLSFIFNFESIREFRPRFPATFLAVVAVIALLELGIRSVSDDWLYASSHSKQGSFHFLERNAIPRIKHPHVVILGTSRAADALIPKLLDHELGLPENSTLNLGIMGGRAFDALQFYQRNREQLGQAELVFLMVDEWYFSSGWGLGYRYYLHAPLGERLAIEKGSRLPPLGSSSASALTSSMVPETTEEACLRKKQGQLEDLRTRLLLDGLFNLRLKAQYVPQALAIHFDLGKARSLVLNPDNQLIYDKKLEVGKPNYDPRRFDKMINELYKDFDTHQILVEHVVQLAQMVKADGHQFALMQIPNRAMHQQEVNRLYGPQYQQHLQTLRELAQRLQVPLYIYQFPSELGLEETSYEDYGHMSVSGAHIFTPFLAKIIQKDGLLGR